MNLTHAFGLSSADEDKFTPWTPWSTCTVICNGGTQIRTRVCNADSCNGRTTETINCNTQPCPSEAIRLITWHCFDIIKLPFHLKKGNICWYPKV